jgi:thiamine biosynthesis protein ThiI
VIVRFGGEIGIKSEWTRRIYERILLKNMQETLECQSIAYDRIVRRRGRFYVKTHETQEATEKLARVFGISSVSPAVETSSDIKEIVQISLDMASLTIQAQSGFAVRCHRVGKHSYSSIDVCREVGKHVLDSLKERSVYVNLDNPDHTLEIEVRDAEAYVFVETLRGAGGFPVGSQAKTVALLSGGIDSPVACWLVMKRGCPIVPIYLDNSPLTDEATTTRALDIARKLFEWSFGHPRKVYIVPHGANLQTFVNKAPRRLTCLLCKRMMYRIAERIANLEKAEGIVTGEAIGEQASQTMTNLRVLDEAAKNYPIHRPLLGFDKTETEALARRIGTYEISIRKAKGCSAAPSQPATQARLAMLKEAEEGIDIEKMVDESVNRAEVITI